MGYSARSDETQAELDLVMNGRLRRLTAPLRTLGRLARRR
jgi:hypothetical protein